MRTLVCLMAIALVACGASPVRPAESPRVESVPAVATTLSDEQVADALLARFALPHCEGDHCLDPFPLWSVTDIAVSADRIALAGPGALVSLYADGAWTTLAAPAGEDANRLAVHAVAFSPDGETLVAVGGRGHVYDVTSAGLSVRAVLPSIDEEYGATLSDVLLVDADDVWVLEAEGRLFRLHGGETQVRELSPPLDRLLSLGQPLEEALAVSGPFGGAVVRDVFADTPPDVEPFRTPEQLENLGAYSGCGPSMFDARAEEVQVLIEDLMGERGLTWEQASLEAEASIPPSPSTVPPGLRVPLSGIADDLVRALASTARGRALTPLIRRGFPAERGALARRGDAMTVATTDWEGHAEIWARFGLRGRTFAPAMLASSGLGATRALDVRDDRALIVGAGGRLARVQADDEMPLLTGPNADLEHATAVFLVDDTRALIATEEAQLFDVALADLSIGRTRSLPGVVRAIEGSGNELYAVGDDGLVVRITESEIAALATGVSADLSVVLVLGPRRLIVGGAAGTVVRMDDGAPQRFDRLTSRPILSLVREDGVLYAEIEGAVLRAEGTHFVARPARFTATRGLVPSFRPNAASEVPFVVRPTPMVVAVDEPDAVAPYAALRERYDPTHDVFVAAPTEVAAPYRSDDLSDAVFRYQEGTTCCDSAWMPTEGEMLVGAIGGCEGVDCDTVLSADLTHRLVSLARGTSVSVTPESGASCSLVVEVAPWRSGAPSREVLSCDDGSEARDAALLAHLATLDIDATWEPAAARSDLPEGLGAISGTGFFARDASGRVEIVRVDQGNRHATVVLRLPRGTPAVGGVLPLRWLVPAVGNDGYTTDLRASAFVGRGFFWAGLTPPMLSGSRSEEDAAECEHLVVHDADGHTTLRTAPTSRSEALATLDNGTSITVARREGHWIAIERPRRGWLFERNVTCAD